METVRRAVPQWTDLRAIIRALRIHQYDTQDTIAWAQATRQGVSMTCGVLCISDAALLCLRVARHEFQM